MYVTLRRNPALLAGVLLVALNSQIVAAAAPTPIERARELVDEVRNASYPELVGVRIQIRELSSESDYFRSRPDLVRTMLPARMRYVIFVNPRVFALGAPDDGVRAIVAHELGHMVYYRRGCRLRLLGLARLARSGFRQRFERWADLQAISRGYADGLKTYREWLYRHVPAKSLAEKHRDYYSPQDIDAIEDAAEGHADRFDAWLRHVPVDTGGLSEPTKPGLAP